MGLFQSRPEEPTEWGGLPSEALREEAAAERMISSVGDPAALLGFDLGAITTISLGTAEDDGPRREV